MPDGVVAGHGDVRGGVGPGRQPERASQQSRPEIRRSAEYAIAEADHQQTTTSTCADRSAPRSRRRRALRVILPAIHRVLTGHDADGKAIITSNGPLQTVVEVPAIPGTVFHEVWSTSGSPAAVDNGPDPTLGPLRLAPPPLGTRIRFVDIPPDTAEFIAHGAAKMSEAFAQIGDVDASTAQAGSPHPLMHRTESVDFGVVIEGELTLVLDDSEVVLKPGSVVIQRGTNHAWANRSSRTCRMLFVLVDGSYEPSIAAALARR